MRIDNEESGKRKVFPSLENVLEYLHWQRKKNKDVWVKSFSVNTHCNGRNLEEWEMKYD